MLHLSTCWAVKLLFKYATCPWEGQKNCRVKAEPAVSRACSTTQLWHRFGGSHLESDRGCKAEQRHAGSGDKQRRSGTCLIKAQPVGQRSECLPEKEKEGVRRDADAR